MFYVVYRWKIHSGREQQFQKAWAEVTRLTREHRGGLGSRLHRCPDGTFVAYAQWPDQKKWENSPNIPLPDTTALTEMREAIASSEPIIQMNLLVDLLNCPQPL
jgi:quinol monooxygenase YgiN